MNNRDLAALAALGAMGYMYKRHLDGQGTEAAPADAAAGRYPPAEDFVNRGALSTVDAKRDIRGGGFDNTPAGGAGDAAAISDMLRYNRSDAGGGVGPAISDMRRYERPGSGSGKGGGSGSAAGTTRVLGGTSVGSPFANRDSAPDVVPDVAPEESSGMGGAGLAAGAGLGAAGAAAYYARLRAQARAMNPRAQTDALSDTKKMFAEGPDRSPRPITGDLSETQKKFAEGPDRAAIAEAKSRMTQAEIDSELKRLKGKTKGADARAGVSKAAFAAGPTVTRETPTKKRAPVKVEAPTDMDDFNRMLRESKVGSATATTTPATKTPKVRSGAGKVGAALTLAGLGGAANAATDMTAGQRERLAKDVMEGLVSPLGITPGMAGEGSDIGFSDKPLSSAERKKMIEAMSPADRKKMEEALARQNPKLLDAIKRPSAANKRAGGGQIKTKKMASGGMTSTVSSASKRGDGIASRGKTRCKMY